MDFSSLPLLCILRMELRVGSDFAIKASLTIDIDLLMTRVIAPLRSFLQGQLCNFFEDTPVLKKTLLENVFQSLFTFPCCSPTPLDVKGTFLLSFLNLL